MQITSLRWWTSTLVSTFITLIFIYLLKQASAKFHVPVVSDVIDNA